MSTIQGRSARAKSNRLAIAIAGAGTGGLALALALRRRGMNPVVFEKKTEAQIRTEGLFLTLAPNGVNALRALGLADAVVAAGLMTTGLRLFNERGKSLGLMDYGSHSDRFGAPSVTIRRGALSAALLDAVQQAGIDIRFATPVDDVAQHDAEVQVTAAGTAERFDALVACDGLRSQVRRRSFPDLPPPHYTGLIGTGGLVDVPGVASTDGIMNMTFGRRAFFGYLAEPGRPVMWFNTYPAPESATGAIDDPAAYARFIAGLHRGDPLDNARIIGAVRSIERNYPIYDMPELPHWSQGRVLLMGDAAHAVAPHSGQGASMAIEDGVVLAACLEADSGVEGAFDRFFRLRQARTQTVIRIGRMAGSQKHAQSWLALRIRDLLLPIFLPLGMRAQEKVFGFRPDRNPLAQPTQ